LTWACPTTSYFAGQTATCLYHRGPLPLEPTRRRCVSGRSTNVIAVPDRCLAHARRRWIGAALQLQDHDASGPAHSCSIRHIPSDPWLDDECHAAKRSTRQLERAVRRAVTCDAPAAAAAWVAQRRGYAALRRRKHKTFWQNKIDIESKDPRQLWRSVDALMGSGRVTPSMQPS